VVKISSNRLRALASDVGAQHGRLTGMRQQRAAIAGEADLRTRRRFLGQLGVGGAAVAAGSSLLPALRLLPAGAQEEAEVTDEDLAAFMASAERTAVEVYAQAVSAGQLTGEALAAAGRFSDHHEEYAETMGDVAGATEEANPGLLGYYAQPIEDAVDELSWLNVLLSVEEELAATYTELLGEVGAELAGVMATILPVEGQQAVVIGHATGELEPNEYLPALQTRTGAFNPASYPTE
jgi:hypothetical protein